MSLPCPLRRAAVLCAALCAALTTAVQTTHAADGDQVSWKNGLRFESADGSTSIKFGGRLHHDYAWILVDDDFKAAEGEIDDGSEMRRARLFMSGTLYHEVEFKLQFDFAGGTAGFRDAYMGLRLPAIGTVRVGQQHEPVGLEVLTSSNYITFMELGANTLFNPDRNVGLRIQNSTASKAVNGSIGIFRRADGQGTTANGDAFDVAARITGSPWYQEDGRKLLHVGVAGVYSGAPDDTLRYHARPEIHWVPRQVDTGKLPAKSAMLLNAEAAVVMGPVSAQGEFAYNRLDSPALSDPALTAWYGFVSWFVTGESRAYSRSGGTFSRVKPRNNLRTGGEGGSGAWELALRVSGIDLNDGMVSGGEMSSLTAAVNWYLNPAARIMANYVRADVKGTGVISAVQTRFQIDF